MICKIDTGEKIISVQASVGQSLHELIHGGCSEYDAPCGGNGRCGKCIVIAEGNLSDISSEEFRILSAEQIEEGMRLACRTTVNGDCSIKLIKKRDANIETGSNTNVIFDSPVEGRYGVAVDIGTTTVAVYFINLKTRKIVGTDAFINPQRSVGADVISRISSVIDDYSELYSLQAILVKEINASLNKLCRENGCDISEIDYFSVAGNTTMQHIFALRDCRGIAVAPFKVDTYFGEYTDASQLGLIGADGAKVYLAPCFSAYVGGDISAGLAVTGYDHLAGKILFIDIGTNGEMALCENGRMILCSTAAGPAFEGAHISCGMGGVTGAVDSVYADADGLPVFSVIGGGAPLGICGSAMIDATAYLLDAGILDESGCIDSPFEICENVTITPHDIREIQLAKAAIRAGTDTLLNTAGITETMVDRLIIAGGFGAHINPVSACRIGLLPPSLKNRIFFAGNTAGAGAAAYLLSSGVRNSIADIRSRADYIELSSNAFFTNAFIDRMSFDEE